MIVAKSVIDFVRHIVAGVPQFFEPHIKAVEDED